MYARSFYNIKVGKTNLGNPIIFNSLTGAFGILDDSMIEIFNNIENITDIPSYINSEAKKNHFNTLLKYGFLIDADINENNILKFYFYS